MNTSSIKKLSTAATENLMTHFSWIHQRIDGMVVRETEHYVLVDCGLPCDTFNAVCRAQMTHESAPQQIKEALDYFAGVNRPFSWWVSPGDQPDTLAELLMGAGLEHAETELAMSADLNTLTHVDLSPEGLAVRRVRTQAELQDFARVVAANWTPPDMDVLRFYDLAAPVLLTDESPLWQYVGYLAGVPVATSELVVGGGVVGLYNICTLTDYRRRGFAAALTLQPLLHARAQGHRTAILQASDGGAGVYRRVGFEAFGQVTEYKPPNS